MSDSSQKAARDHRAMQLNPQHPAYYRARGLSEADAIRAAEAAHQANVAHAAVDARVDVTANPPTGARRAR